MPEFELRISTDSKEKTARLKLFRADGHQAGSHVGSNSVRLPEHSAALWEGLFDTRRYVERYTGAMLFEGRGIHRPQQQCSWSGWASFWARPCWARRSCRP